MKCQIIDEGGSAEWDEFVFRNPDVINWHRFDWHKVVQRHRGIKYYPIALYDGGRICGILPLYQVHTLRTGTVLVSIPYVAVGGIIADTSEGRQQLWKRAVELSDELGEVPIILKQYRHQIEGDLATDDGFYNRELNLHDDLDTIWNGLHETNRYKIEASRTLPLEIEYPSQNIHEYAKLLLSFQRRRGKPSSVTPDWVRLLVNTGMYSVALMKMNEATVAAALVKRFKDMVSFPWSCLSDRHPQAEDLAYRFYWDLIRRCKEDGLRIFHSGRTPLNDDVPGYRLGWGGTTERYYYQYFRMTTSGESKSIRSNGRRLFESVWKWCPDPLAGLVGPAIVKQFP